MNFIPVLLGVASAFCFGSSDLLSRGASKVVGPYGVAVSQLFVGTIIMTAFVMVLPPSFVLTPYPVVLMVAAALLNLGSLVFLYKGLHKGVVSVVAPIVYSYPAITLVLSVILLHVSISPLLLLALGGIIAGAVMVSTRFSELKVNSISPGVYPAIVAALLGGIAYLAVGASVVAAGPILPVVFIRAVGAFSGFLIAPIVKQSVTITRYTFSPRIIAVGSLGLMAYLTFNTGVSLSPGSLPIVTALSGMSSAFEVSYAVIFIREKLELNQLGGILLLIAGVFVLLYLST